MLDESLQHQSVEASDNEGFNDVQKADYDAFRTTTTFLATIHSLPGLRRPNTKASKTSADHNERRVLKLCNAFATLAVIRHEVVAVGVGYNVTSPQTPQRDVEILLTSHLLVNQNPRQSEKGTLTNLKGDEICSPNPPDKLRSPRGKKPSERRLRRYIDNLKVTSHDCTMEEHVWMLQKMFNTWHTKEEIQMARLMNYIIITCFPKMWARIKHPRSTLYIDALGSIHVQGLVFARPREMSNSQGTALYEMTIPFLLPPARAKPSENEDDRSFLVNFLKFASDKYPRLREQRAKMKQDPDISLYTEETCEEFCSAVNMLLKEYRENLSKFDQYRSMLAENPNNERDLPLYSCAKVDRLGYMLHMLSRGAALRMYLENVNSLLFDFHQPPPRRLYLFKQPSDVDAEAMLNAEIEAEIAEAASRNIDSRSASEESTTVPLAWQICLEWIKLLVSYFSAASTLISHMSLSEFPPISVHLLRTSPGDDSLLTWKELLENPKYFPRQSPKGFTPMGNDRSNDNIIETIELAIASNPYEHASDLQAIQNLWMQVMDHGATESDKQIIAGLLEQRFTAIERTIGTAGCRKYAKEVIKELQVWQKRSTSRGLSSSLIISKINSMMEICYMFSQFVKPSFSGTVHCEASLANFINRSGNTNASPSAGISKDLKKYGRIIAASNANCPSCHTLLNILRPDEEGFLSRGYHKTVFPCSLPINLKQSTVDEMNSLFGAQLRKELVDFLNNMEPRPRTYSAGSGLYRSFLEDGEKAKDKDEDDDNDEDEDDDEDEEEEED
ncbi:hypothetical protein GALMADRAFT_137084 [Galerina marginata CBS 339.88]|uniref:Uncharacterized protein n=1 Tax=Galerina marginata (strain CBS 339.88) TaxID=685588 RepID=A0A067TH02_GALM3|nr:hypothetical protein GALMADRAFT_137084 [Galerina marginata CBS 339.88]